MLDLSSLAPSLRLDPDGTWRPAGGSAAVDYPDEANAFCYAVEEHSFWFTYRNRFIVDLVRRFPPGGPIADIGAGNGFVSLALQRAGFATLVIEPGATGARNARARGLTPVVAATMQEANFLPGTLAAAGLFDVIEHVADDVGFLRDVGTRLVPGGRLYLTVPAFRALWSSEDDLVGHHHRYSRRQLAARLGAAGFAVDYATYLFSPLLVPLVLLRTIPSRLGRRTTLDPATTAAELKPADGLAVRGVKMLLDVEVGLAARGWRIPFGTSCLVAARAK